MKINLNEVVQGIEEPENIGSALFDAIPAVGTLLIHVAGPGRVSWRVVAVQIAPAEEHSQTARRHERGEQVQLAHVELFVVAAEGPFGADAYERFVASAP